jgi:hypothetical protein
MIGVQVIGDIAAAKPGSRHLENQNDDAGALLDHCPYAHGPLANALGFGPFLSR